MKGSRLPAARDAEPILEFSLAEDWSDWLRANHASSQAVLLRIPKNGADKAITYADALDEVT